MGVEARTSLRSFVAKLTWDRAVWESPLPYPEVYSWAGLQNANCNSWPRATWSSEIQSNWRLVTDHIAGPVNLFTFGVCSHLNYDERCTCLYKVNFDNGTKKGMTRTIWGSLKRPTFWIDKKTSGDISEDISAVHIRSNLSSGESICHVLWRGAIPI